MPTSSHLDIAIEVADALRAGRPVVALESTIISHGMPYPQNVDTALRVEQAVRDGSAIPATIAGLTENPPDPERLASLQSRLKYSFLMGLDTPDRVASSMARYVAVTGGIEAVARLYATYASVTPDDIVAAARKYLDPNRRTVACAVGATIADAPAP